MVRGPACSAGSHYKVGSGSLLLLIVGKSPLLRAEFHQMVHRAAVVAATTLTVHALWVLGTLAGYVPFAFAQKTFAKRQAVADDRFQTIAKDVLGRPAVKANVSLSSCGLLQVALTQ